MAQQWQIDGPRVLDIGTEAEAVAVLKVALVAGRVDIVTHDDSPTARLEVHEVTGPPLTVEWNSATLRVSHVTDNTAGWWDQLKRLGTRTKDASARVSLSVPATATVGVGTVSAETLITGVGADVSARTVSGRLTLADLTGQIGVNTVSGTVEADHLDGALKVKTVSGAVTVRNSRLNPVRLNTVSGDVTLDLTNQRLELNANAVSGDVTVRIPSGGGYDVSARSVSGHVVIDGQAMSAAAGTSKGESRLTDGDRSLQIAARSVSGDVVVLRAADRPGHAGGRSAAG